jgi:hypothetical protein
MFIRDRQIKLRRDRNAILTGDLFLTVISSSIAEPPRLRPTISLSLLMSPGSQFIHCGFLPGTLNREFLCDDPSKGLG